MKLPVSPDDLQQAVDFFYQRYRIEQVTRKEVHGSRYD